MNWDQFVNEADIFLNQIFLEMQKKDIQIFSHWNIDHLCYRVNSEEHYRIQKNNFLKFSTLIIESEVNGRLISTFKLHQKIYFKEWVIDVVELPAPKKGKITIEGFEHIEIVIDRPFQEIIQQYSLRGCVFDTKGLQKNLNQELEIILNDKAIKFHYISLESVVNLEKNKSVFNALMTSQILNIFKTDSPLVCGTFPLNLDVDNSDIDILIATKNLESTKRDLTTHFGQFEEFKLDEFYIKDVSSLVCRFKFKSVVFEIFCEPQNAILQTAYQHFLLEERLLKLGGYSFWQKIKNLRNQDLKTEAAFCQALNLKTADPFAELLKLQLYSEKQLNELIVKSMKT